MATEEEYNPTLTVETNVIGAFKLPYVVKVTIEIIKDDTDNTDIYCVECGKLSLIDCRHNLFDAIDGLEETLFESIVEYIFYDDDAPESEDVKKLRDLYEEIMYMNWKMFYNRRKAALNSQLSKLEAINEVQ